MEIQLQTQFIPQLYKFIDSLNLSPIKRCIVEAISEQLIKQIINEIGDVSAGLNINGREVIDAYRHAVAVTLKFLDLLDVEGFYKLSDKLHSENKNHE